MTFISAAGVAILGVRGHYDSGACCGHRDPIIGGASIGWRFPAVPLTDGAYVSEGVWLDPRYFSSVCVLGDPFFAVALYLGKPWFRATVACKWLALDAVPSSLEFSPVCSVQCGLYRLNPVHKPERKYKAGVVIAGTADDN